jgi:ABC-2 type transport system ATP-binding protein
VGLADALVGDPKILILDEPTIGLDPNQIRQVRDLVRDLGKERTVILSSHILPEVEAVCSRVQIIHKGRLVGQGRPDELRSRISGGGASVSVEVLDPSNAAELVLSGLDGVDTLSAPTRREEGVIDYTIQTRDERAVRERIFDAAVKEGFKLLGLKVDSASLEDIFVQITTSETEDEAAGGEAPDKGGAS